MVNRMGYDIISESTRSALYDRVRFENFANLARAYERLLSESGKVFTSSDARLKLLARLQGTPPSEAYYIVDALEKSKGVAGDVCEFGIAQGETSALIANEIMGGDKILHLLDSFEGLSKPSEKDQLKDDIFSLGSIEAYAGTMSCPEDMVRSRLESISFPSQKLVIHKGFIDQVLKTDRNLPRAVSFAYIDFDLYEPIKVTLNFLHSVTSAGSIIIVDDYNYFSTGVASAVNEFLSENNSGALIYDLSIPSTVFGHFAVLKRNF